MTTAMRGMAAPASERRVFPVTELRLQPPDAAGAAGAAGGPGRLSGHAAIFDVLSDDLGGFREIVERGTFADTIGPNGDDIRALFNHDPNFVLGRNRAQTLTLAEDERGLAIAIALPDTNAGRDLAVSVERGDVSQMSFGFSTIEDVWERNTEAGAQQDLRRLRKVQLFDVSPVTFPAYPQTDVALRSLEEWRAANGGGDGGDGAPSGGPSRLARARRRLALLEPSSYQASRQAGQAGPGARGAVASHSTSIAGASMSWSAPTLGDFTADAWADLSRAEQRRIVNHAAGYTGDWPAAFGDIHLWHHRAGTSGVGALVPRGLFASAGRFGQVGSAGVDAATRAGMARHLIGHYKQMEMDPPAGLVAAAG